MAANLKKNNYSLDSLGRNFLCLFLGQPGFSWWLSFARIGVVWHPRISKRLNTLFLLSAHLCLITDFICDLFVAHNDS